jgi:HSP20 family molecular chaperone IbpA
MPKIVVHDGANNHGAAVAPHDYLNGFQDAVQRRAFSIFEERGRTHGRETDDWLQAERELLCFPETTLHSDGKRVTVTAKVEGFQSSDLKVTAWPREIVIEGGAARHNRTEACMLFCRVATDPIDSAAVRASLSKGVLRIEAPLALAGKPPLKPHPKTKKRGPTVKGVQA